MALDTERRAAGFKSILRRLRGEAPRPLQPEDQIEGIFGTEGETKPLGPEEDEEALESASPAAPAYPPVPPRIRR